MPCIPEKIGKDHLRGHIGIDPVLSPYDIQYEQQNEGSRKRYIVF